MGRNFAKYGTEMLAEGVQRSTGHCGGYIHPDRNFRCMDRKYPVLVRIYPVLGPDISGPCLPVQREDFWRGYKYLSTYLWTNSSPTSKSTIRASSDLQLLPIHPSISADLWRIEGGGSDLHLHQAYFHFPLILLRVPC